MWVIVAGSAWATALSLRDTVEVAPGVVLQEWQAFSPTTDVWSLSIDLCEDGVYVDARRADDSTLTTGSFASDQGQVAATNGDFYKTGPLRVYGDAVGGGVRWPLEQTGLDPDYAGEWYWEHGGWIAFTHDGVVWSHTGWVKENAALFGGALGGWEPKDPRPDPPPGTLALVSGFSELIVEGVRVTCADPTASDCFPDRSDMRDRHPRTAMGLTADLQTFLLVVVDGRTGDNTGMYGTELADTMEDLGAWVAFNLDGGGSSQLWADGGYVNDYDGNNYGGGARSIANHWGVWSGGYDWLPTRPGHCASAAPCGTLPPSGGTIDNADACFRGFGDQDYWRHEEGAGEGGSLQWTNAFDSESPDNWAWWRVELEEAGQYRVEVLGDATWSVYDDVRYEVRAGGVSSTVFIDPTAGGWVSLGSYVFAAGGDQWVAVFDDLDGAVPANQHVVADAIRLVREGSWCGDGLCDPSEQCVCDECPVVEEVPANLVDDDCDGDVDEARAVDTGVHPETGAETGSDPRETGDPEPPDGRPDLPPVTDEDLSAGTRVPAEEGCGCRVGAPTSAPWALLAWWLARRRRPVRRCR
jgi:hypothetical protein